MKYKLFIIALISIYFYSLIYLNQSIAKLFLSTLFIGAIIILCQIILNLFNKSKYSLCKRYALLLLMLTVWMLLITLFNISFGFGDYSLSRIIQDLISMIILTSGFILASLKKNELFLKKYLKLITIIALISGLIALYYADFSLGRDLNVWKPQYIWWGLLFPWSYILIYKSIVMNKSKRWAIVSYFLMILYITLGVLFGKRIVFYELLVVISVILIAKQNKNFIWTLLKSTRILVVFSMLLFLSSLFFSDINLISNIQQTLDRFTDLSVSNFDRFDEFANVFNEYPITFIFTGTGLGSQHTGPGGINMHIGWLNYIFKGGLMYFLVELWVFKLAIQSLFKSKHPMHLFTAASVVASYCFILIVSSWVASPITIIFSIMKFTLLRYLSEDVQIKSNANKLV